MQRELLCMKTLRRMSDKQRVWSWCQRELWAW